MGETRNRTMADNDKKRRFRSNRSRTVDPTAASVRPQADTATPAWAQGASPRRPATVQATQDVVDVAAFIGKVETERSQGRPTPTPQPMQNVLGVFGGAPGTQTAIQVLAAAATARHFGGAQSANALKWEALAQENAARLEATRAQQYRQEQARYAASRMPQEQIHQRAAERANADAEVDRRVFDAAAALALSYVAARSLPPFGKLAALSYEHLAVPNPSLDDAPEAMADRPIEELTENPTIENDTNREADRTPEEEAGTEVVPGVDLDKDTPDAREIDAEAESEDRDTDALEEDIETSADVVEDADVSDELEQVTEPAQEHRTAPTSGPDLGKLGSVLESAGRGIATAIGPVQGDDEVAPPLSPVDLSQLSQELLGALGAAMSGHPRTVQEMLNIEREPDRDNESAFVPEMGIKRVPEMAVGPS